MDWMNARQKRIPLNVTTVADLIKVLQQLPQNHKIVNADEDDFCEINIATDCVEDIVMLY